VKEMPFKTHVLDSSLKEEGATIIVGKNIILKLVERPYQKTLLKDSYVQTFLKTPDLTYKDTIKKINRLVEIDYRLNTLAYQESFLGFAQSLFFDPNVRKKFLGEKAGREFEESLKKSMEEVKIEKSFKDFSQVLKELKKMSEEEIDQFSEVMSMGLTKLPEAYFEFIKKTIEESNKESIEIEKSLRVKNQKLELLRSVAVPFCPHCKKSLFLGDKSRYGLIKGAVKCRSCRKKVTSKDATYLYMNRLHPSLNPSVILLEKIKEKHVDQLVQELKDSPIGKSLTGIQT